MIDTHAHIYSEEFSGEIDLILENASAAGISKILMPNIDVSTIDSMIQLERAYPEQCYAMMGLHPCYVKEDFKEQLEVIEGWFRRRKFLAVGEIGTDLYWDKTYWKEQVEAFHFQCELALTYDLPVVIHCRDSIDENIALVEEYSSRSLRGVFHCFTGSLQQAEKILSQGFYLGIGGVATFKNGGLDKVIPHLDQNKIVLETDAPYLAPAPKRGKRNEPSYLSHICSKLSGYLQMSTEEIDQLTTLNAKKLFFPG